MELPLIAAENEAALWAAMLAVAAFSLWAGERTAIGRRISGIAIAIFAAIGLSNLGVLPKASGAYDTVFELVLPTAIPLLLFDAHLARIIRECRLLLLAFLLGTAATLAGVLAGLLLIDLGPDAPALAGIFAATYIGGSMNFAAVAKAAGFLESDLLAASIAADQLVTNLYIIGIMVLPGLALVRRLFRSDIIAAAERAPGEDAQDGPQAHPFRPAHICLLLGLAVGIVAAGNALAAWSGADGYEILFITALALLPANLAPGYLARLSGAQDTGMILIYLFLIAIGAGADVTAMVGPAFPITLFALVVVSVHLVVILALGRLAGLDLAEIIIASNANIGGSSSAGPIAAARGWSTLVTPAILVGVIGNAIATFLGVGLVELLR